MSSELLNALLRRRFNVDAAAQTWESRPEQSSADASHLASLSFDGPVSGEWLRGLERTPEEDLLREALDEELAARASSGPTHTPVAASREGAERLHELVVALAALQRQLAVERSEQGEAREELARREADLLAREEGLEAERERQRLREEACRSYPQPAWLTNVEGTLNVGVVGNAGVGKSLLINRLRRIRPHAEGWAPVGVNETTTAPQVHCFPDEPRVRLWDIPGAGTVAVPNDTYIQDMGLRYFDKVIIVTAGRFTSTEVALRAELEKHGVPFFMVRTKVDIDVWNNREDNGLDEQATLSLIAQDLQQCHGVAEPYLVSLRDAEAYDMPRLVSDLFPGLKRQLNPAAPCFYPSAGAWGDAWVLPPTFSAILAGLQGRWRDCNAVYLVQGNMAHVTLQTGKAAVVHLEETSGQVWWCGRWSVREETVLMARRTGQVHWLPQNSTDGPIIWFWYD